MSAIVYRDSLPPREIEFLASGSLVVRVPLLTTYVARGPSPDQVVSWTNVTYDDASTWSLRWLPETALAEPVRFVFAGANSTGLGHHFSPASDDTFLYIPVGTVTTGSLSMSWSLGPGADSGVIGTYWNVSYTVRRLVAFRGLGEESWVQVDYQIRELVQGGFSFEEMGVPWTSGEDLDYHSSWSGFASLTLTRGGDRPVTPRYVGEPFALSAGRLGDIVVRLSSEFAQPGGYEYSVHIESLGGPPSDPVDATAYIDLRFGTLYVELTNSTGR